MRYNVKGFKSIKFTEIKKNPMDGYDIKGYLNDDKKYLLQQVLLL